MHKKFLNIALVTLCAVTGCAPMNNQIPPPEGTHIANQTASRLTAKNVILFIGDGMSIDTVTAARIFAGQLQNKSGEENLLAFETLPYTALSKTYNTNQQVPDSAGTATAMLSGQKTLAGVIGVGPQVIRGNCASAQANSIATLIELAEDSNLSTGIVSTARITHATPAAAYAHSADRNWENDQTIPAEQRECIDIARQLIEFSHGDGIDIVLGGGRAQFLPQSAGGQRTDDRNLIDEWLRKNTKERVFVENASALQNATRSPEPAASKKKIFGLFSASHMSYEADRETLSAQEPSLAEMTAASVSVLQKSDNGYFLLVEGGRIDHAHHEGKAARALIDTVAFSDAVDAALHLVSLQDTLVIVTADHGHTMSIGGYATRGNPILGLVVENDPSGAPMAEPAKDIHGKPYTTLSYANGPGATAHKERDISMQNTAHIDYLQIASVALEYGETHSGTDVAIYAGGPGAEHFHGVMEQNRIFDVISTALGLNAPSH